MNPDNKGRFQPQDHLTFAVFQIYWPAPVDWREECNWAGKDITVSPLTPHPIFYSIFNFILQKCTVLWNLRRLIFILSLRSDVGYCSVHLNIL